MKLVLYTLGGYWRFSFGGNGRSTQNNRE